MRRPVSKVSTSLTTQINTAAAKQSSNTSQQRLTIGLDLVDRNSWYWVLDEAGQKQRVRNIAPSVRFHAKQRSARAWADLATICARAGRVRARTGLWCNTIRS